MERELEDFHKYWDDQAMYDYSPEKLRRFDDECQRYREAATAELFDGSISIKYLEKVEKSQRISTREPAIYRL